MVQRFTTQPPLPRRERYRGEENILRNGSIINDVMCAFSSCVHVIVRRLTMEHYMTDDDNWPFDYADDSEAERIVRCNMSWCAVSV